MEYIWYLHTCICVGFTNVDRPFSSDWEYNSKQNNPSGEICVKPPTNVRFPFTVQYSVWARNCQAGRPAIHHAAFFRVKSLCRHLSTCLTYKRWYYWLNTGCPTFHSHHHQLRNKYLMFSCSSISLLVTTEGKPNRCATPGMSRGGFSLRLQSVNF